RAACSCLPRKSSATKKLIKPGPAISAFATALSAGSAAISASARSRGFLPAGLASSMATLLAKSPWRLSRVRSIWIDGLASAGTTPCWRRVSMACSSREAIRSFMALSATGLGGDCTGNLWLQHVERVDIQVPAAASCQRVLLQRRLQLLDGAVQRCAMVGAQQQLETEAALATFQWCRDRAEDLHARVHRHTGQRIKQLLAVAGLERFAAEHGQVTAGRQPGDAPIIEQLAADLVVIATQ